MAAYGLFLSDNDTIAAVKFTKTLRILLSLQILMFAWAMAIFHSTSHDNSFNWLQAFLPLGGFLFLGGVNAVLAIISNARTGLKKTHTDTAVIVLAAINVILALFYDSFIRFASSF